MGGWSCLVMEVTWTTQQETSQLVYLSGSAEDGGQVLNKVNGWQLRTKKSQSTSLVTFCLNLHRHRHRFTFWVASHQLGSALDSPAPGAYIDKLDWKRPA